jgi:membrane protease YdiL (CAAX protease family)
LQDFNKEDNNQPNLNWIKRINPFFYVILVLGIIFFLYQVIGGLLAFISGGEKLEGDLNLMRFILSFGQFMFILAPTIFFVRLQSSDIKYHLKLNFPKSHLVLLMLLGIILIQPFLQGYLYFQDVLLNHLPVLRDTIKQLKETFDSLDSSTLKIVTSYSVIEFLVVVFVICVTPAICEEVLFRGFVLTNIRKVSKAPVAIIISSLFFSLYHFQPFNIIPLAILGGFLGFVVYYSNSIYLGMLCHFFNNFFATYYLYKYGKQDFDTPRLTNSEVFNYGMTALGSLVLFLLVLFIFYKFRDRKSDEEVRFE